MAFASDSFTNTDLTVLPTHNSAWVISSSLNADTAVIRSNALTGNSNTGSVMYVHDTAPSANYDVSATIKQISTNTSANAGIVGRATSTSVVGYMARYKYGTGVQLFKFDGTTAVQLGSSVAGNLSNGGTMTLLLRCDGDQISLYKNGSLAIGPITDTYTSAANSPGVWLLGSGTVGCSIDDWSATELASGSSIAALSNHYNRLRRG